MKMFGRKTRGFLYIILFCASVGLTSYGIFYLHGRLQMEQKNVEEPSGQTGEDATADSGQSQNTVTQEPKQNDGQLHVKEVIEDSSTADGLKGEAQYVHIEPHVDSNQPIAAAALDEPRIVSTTRLVFRTKVEGNDKFDVTESEPTFHHVGKTRTQIQDMYQDYQLQSFSEEMVVFDKVMAFEEVDLGNAYFVKAIENKVYCYNIDGYTVKKNGDSFNIYTPDGDRVNEEELIESIYNLPEELSDDEKQRFYNGFPCDLNAYIELCQNLSS